VLGEVAARDFLFDERFHLAQRLEHAEIEIAPVDERPHALGMDQLPGRDPGDGARLDPGITLPVPPMRL